MPNVNQMRQAIIAAYPGKSWKQKVNQMSDNQIIAIFSSLKEREEQEKKEQERQMRLF
jgi:hypothetical protein